MFLNSIQQQHNGTMSAVQQKRVRNSFALQRNLEWGEFPYTGLNIVPAGSSAEVTNYSAKNDHSCMLVHAVYSKSYSP